MVENQPSNLLQLYQHKLEKCQINFDKLVEGFDSLNSQLKERIAQELMVEKAEEKVCSLSDTLGRTQSLLLIERKNSQEMALHIDLLLEQHKADVKRLDLILALDGKTVRNEGRTELSLLRTHVKKLENVLREQAASLLEERSLLKVEWEKERQSSDKSKREMKSKLQILKNQVIQLNQHAAKYHRNSIEHFLRGNYLEVDADIDDDTSHQASGPNNNQFTLKTHCLDQETKKLKVNYFFFCYFQKKFQISIDNRGNVRLCKRKFCPIKRNVFHRLPLSKNSERSYSKLEKNIKSVSSFIL